MPGSGEAMLATDVLPFAKDDYGLSGCVRSEPRAARTAEATAGALGESEWTQMLWNDRCSSVPSTATTGCPAMARLALAGAAAAVASGRRVSRRGATLDQQLPRGSVVEVDIQLWDELDAHRLAHGLV